MSAVHLSTSEPTVPSAQSACSLSVSGKLVQDPTVAAPAPTSAVERPLSSAGPTASSSGPSPGHRGRSTASERRATRPESSSRNGPCAVSQHQAWGQAPTGVGKAQAVNECTDLPTV